MRIPILASLILTACAATTVQPDPAVAEPALIAEPTTTVYVVRHAEKADDGDDPSLTERGQARAEALALRLADEPLVAVYSTPYARTTQTASPTAAAHGLIVTEYDPRSDLSARILEEHTGAAVLVVGHSNTVPGIVLGLGAPEQPEIPHERYGDLYRVSRVGAEVELVVERFGD